jgi:hypothetical protein
MTTLDDLRRKAEAEARGEAVFIPEADTDIDLKSFVEEDPTGQAALDTNMQHMMTVGKVPMRKDAHWASGTFSPCLRRDWLDFHGAKPTDMNTNYDIFGMGDSVEDQIVNKYLLAGQYVRTQERITINDPRLRFPIVGKIDLLIRSKKEIDLLIEVDDELVAVEAKSVKDFGEDYGWNVWKKYLPKKEHVGQLTLYIKGMELKHGYISVYNKQRSITVRYMVSAKGDFDRFYDAIIQRFVETEASLPGPEPSIPQGFKGRAFPCVWFSRSPDHKNVPAGTCQYFSHCFAEHPIALAFP